MAQQIVLVLQGGGALGAYHGGVYEAMHEAGLEPEWVIGTSIGAINGAIIAGNPVETRLERLHDFWRGVEQALPPLASPLWQPLNGAVAHWATIMGGVNGLFRPRAPFLMNAPVGIERASYYDNAPLRETLAKLVHPEALAQRKPRLTVGAVKVARGAMRYFDSRHMEITLDHVMASGALPPAFGAVRIHGEAYWDGGVYSNTPLEVIFDDDPRRDSLVFAANVWQPVGPEPESLWEVLGRQKDIQYASRADSNIAQQKKIHHMRRVIRELVKSLPPEKQAEPECR
jgi:NTE family protein